MTPKIDLAAMLHWYGKPGATLPVPMTRYTSNDIIVIGDQLAAMTALDIRGATLGTYGPFVSPFIHENTVEVSHQVAERGMLFALRLDPWVTKNQTGDKTALVKAALMHPDIQAMLMSRAYLPERYIFDMGTGADPDALNAAIPGIKMLTLAKHFSWPSFDSKAMGDQLPFVLSKLQAHNSNPDMLVPGVCPFFNDGKFMDRNKSVWGDNSLPSSQLPNARIIESSAGNAYWDQVALMPAMAKYCQIISWNDYYERTAIEPFASMMSARIGR